VLRLINVRRVAALRKLGLMTPAGEQAFAARKQSDYEAWRWFASQAPWYRKACIHRVTSARQTATQERRLTTLLTCSAAGRAVPPLTRPTGK
jgi:hypothetical protein